MIHRCRKLTQVLIVAGAVLAGANARAGDPALAELLFREARALMSERKYAAACPKLAESFAQDPATGTLLALGVCHEEAGSTASAWSTFADVMTRARREGQPERERAARERHEALTPKLSRLTIEVAPALAALPGLRVKRNGVAVGRAAFGTAAPVDPGEYVVEVSAPGKLPWKRSVTVGGPADHKLLRVDALDDQPPAVAAAPHSEAAGTGQAPSSSPASSRSPLPLIGVITAGAGVVGLGASGFFAYRARSLNEDSKGAGLCDSGDFCSREGQAKRDDAIAAARVATITLVAGSLLAATGATLFVVGNSQSGVKASGTLAPGEAGAVLRGSF